LDENHVPISQQTIGIMALAGRSALGAGCGSKSRPNNTVNRRYQLRVCELLDVDARQRLLAILSRPAGEPRSLWDQVKREPKRSTVPQFKDFLDHLHWLQQQNVAASAFAEIPEAKIRQFAAEARSLDLTSLNGRGIYQVRPENRRGSCLCVKTRLPSGLFQRPTSPTKPEAFRF
jgi:hypothetical protein